MIENLDDLGETIAQRARDSRLKVSGPVSTDLGYGGAPIVTFWSEDRRIHFSFGAYEGAVSVFIEAVDRGAESGARVGRISTVDQAWAAIEGFLGKRKSLHRLPDLGWVGEEPMHDALIPHPPAPPPAPAPEPAAPRTGAAQAASAEIGGVILFSNDASKLAHWYGEFLGVAFTEESGNFHGEAGGVTFGIYPSGDLLSPGVRAMLTFRVAEFDSFVEGLATRGVGVEGLDRSARGRFAYIRDSDGNPVELWDGG